MEKSEALTKLINEKEMHERQIQFCEKDSRAYCYHKNWIEALSMAIEALEWEITYDQTNEAIDKLEKAELSGSPIDGMIASEEALQAMHPKEDRAGNIEALKRAKGELEKEQ